MRLIRSKGVGVFFVTQTPKDVPDDVLAQLGNRVQHALRAFTPDDAKALKATVRTYPHIGATTSSEVLTQLGIGEAVVTVLSERGAPTPVAWTRLRAPQSLMAPGRPAAMRRGGRGLAAARRSTPRRVDRESAYERLQARLAAAPAPRRGAGAPHPPLRPLRRAQRAPKEQESMVQQVLGSSAVRSMLRSAGTALGREITRSLFDTARRRR